VSLDGLRTLLYPNEHWVFFGPLDKAVKAPGRRLPRLGCDPRVGGPDRGDPRVGVRKARQDRDRSTPGSAIRARRVDRRRWDA